MILVFCVDEYIKKISLRLRRIKFYCFVDRDVSARSGMSIQNYESVEACKYFFLLFFLWVHVRIVLARSSFVVVGWC